MIRKEPNDIKKYILLRHKKNEADLSVQEKKELDNFAAIGSLLTDEKLCKKYLIQLNKALVEYAKVQKGLVEKISEKTSVLHKPKQDLFKNPVMTKQPSNVRPDLLIVKHHKVLTGFLNQFEAKEGFNLSQENGPLANASGPATLTRFVRQDRFRNVLFKNAFHWKDAGVGVTHGEFTHRLQWYIIVEHHRAKPFLSDTPVSVFKMFGEPRWVHNPDNEKSTGAWDDVLDMVKTDTDSFRCPDILHAWLKEPRRQKNHGCAFLAQLISGRSAKRELASHLKEYYDPRVAARVESDPESVAVNMSDVGIVWFNR